MEEDAGKLVHFKTDSGVDYNRGGVPLIEIVSEPDLRSPKESYEYLRALKTILEYLNVSDCNMEEGSLRCDANVSIRPKGAKEFGTKAEIKNMNSFHNVEKAIEYEIERQKEVLAQGGRVVQETRLWDADQGLTRSMRSKEEAHDYRYFPEPDLVPVVISKEEIEKIRKSLPELPHKRKERFVRDYALPEYDAGVLTAQRSTADYFEESTRLTKNVKAVSNWMMGDLMKEMNQNRLDFTQCPVAPKDLAKLVDLIDQGTITGKIAKDVFLDMFKTGKNPQDIVQSKGLTQIADSSQIEEVIRKVLMDHQKTVEDYFGGKKNAVTFLIGQIMKATQGRVNPKMANELLIKEIEKLRKES